MIYLNGIKNLHVDLLCSLLLSESLSLMNGIPEHM